MDLADVSTYFDDDPVYDGYTGALLFNAQVSSFDDSHSDGATSRRRVLSLAPGYAMPTRRAVQLYGDNWIVGTGTPDGFYGSVVRQHFGMKLATDLLTLLTPGQVLANAAGTQAWVHKFYFKDALDSIDNAEIDTFWNIFIAPGEPASKGSFFKDAGGRLYRVRNDYLPVEGLRVCQSDTLDVGALRSVTWQTGAYDPINDVVAAGSTVVQAVALETPKFYRFRELSDPALQKGDMAVFVPTTVTPKQGDIFAMAGVNWRAVTVQAEMDVWAIHARRA